MEPSLSTAEEADQPERDTEIMKTDTDNTQDPMDHTSTHNEDHNDDDEEQSEEPEEDDTSAAMRAAMGFSSFGVDKKKPNDAARGKSSLSTSASAATGPNSDTIPMQDERAGKKRKFSARFEAVVAAAPPSPAPGRASADTAPRIDARRGEKVEKELPRLGHGLPPKPQFAGTDAAPGVSLPTTGKQTAIRSDEDTQRQGVRGGGTAVEGYFSPSFIEDPWAPLLAARAQALALGQSS